MSTVKTYGEETVCMRNLNDVVSGRRPEAAAMAVRRALTTLVKDKSIVGFQVGKEDIRGRGKFLMEVKVTLDGGEGKVFIPHPKSTKTHAEIHTELPLEVVRAALIAPLSNLLRI